jgi:hypothetical protein
VALDAKALIRSGIELDRPSAQVVTQPQHFARARRQLKELLVREEWGDGQCKRAAEKVCPVGLLELLVRHLLGLGRKVKRLGWEQLYNAVGAEHERIAKGLLVRIDCLGLKSLHPLLIFLFIN